MQPIHLAASGDKTRIVDILVDEYHVDPHAKVLYTYRQIVASFTSYIAISFHSGSGWDGPHSSCCYLGTNRYDIQLDHQTQGGS